MMSRGDGQSLVERVLAPVIRAIYNGAFNALRTMSCIRLYDDTC